MRRRPANRWAARSRSGLSARTSGTRCDRVHGEPRVFLEFIARRQAAELRKDYGQLLARLVRAGLQADLAASVLMDFLLDRAGDLVGRRARRIESSPGASDEGSTRTMTERPAKPSGDFLAAGKVGTISTLRMDAPSYGASYTG